MSSRATAKPKPHACDTVAHVKSSLAPGVKIADRAATSLEVLALFEPLGNPERR